MNNGASDNARQSYLDYTGQMFAYVYYPNALSPPSPKLAAMFSPKFLKKRQLLPSINSFNSHQFNGPQECLQSNLIISAAISNRIIRIKHRKYQFLSPKPLLKQRDSTERINADLLSNQLPSGSSSPVKRANSVKRLIISKASTPLKIIRSKHFKSLSINERPMPDNTKRMNEALKGHLINSSQVNKSPCKLYISQDKLINLEKDLNCPQVLKYPDFSNGELTPWETSSVSHDSIQD